MSLMEKERLGLRSVSDAFAEDAKEERISDGVVGPVLTSRSC